MDSLSLRHLGSHIHTHTHVGIYILIYIDLVPQMVKNPLAMRETWVRSLGQEDPLEKGTVNPLQYSGLENSLDRGAWRATVHRVAKSHTQLSDFHTRTHTHEEVYCEELAREITETEWTHSLLSPGWRPRKASDLRTKSTKGRGRLTSCLKSSGRTG